MSASTSFLPLAALAVHITGLAPFAPARAQGSAASTPETPASGLFTWGGDVRLRDEYYNGAVSLDTSAPLHEQNHLRGRARVWGAFAPVRDLMFTTRLAVEPRGWTKPSNAKQHAGRTGLEERFVLVDLLNVRWKTGAASLPLTLTLGRQDIQLGEPGEWGLFLDGTPSDGSWATFFDAARARIESRELRTTFELVALDQRASPDDHLRTLGRSGAYAINEQNERGLVLYATHQPAPGRQFNAFFASKHDDRVLPNGDEADLYTAGARFASRASPNWHYSFQGAIQWGEKQDNTVKGSVAATARRDVRAWGGEARLTYRFDDAQDNRLALVGEYLSGDDPGTPDCDEMFDVLWGRWPRFGDVMAYAAIPEAGGRFAQLQNVLRAGPEWSTAPSPGTSLSAAYNFLLAPEDVPTRATKPELFSGGGLVRGHLAQAALRHRFSPRVSGILQAEALVQGDFYARRDVLTFVRIELSTTFY